MTKEYEIAGVAEAKIFQIRIRDFIQSLQISDIKHDYVNEAISDLIVDLQNNGIEILNNVIEQIQEDELKCG